jgi:hypothetical protein
LAARAEPQFLLITHDRIDRRHWTGVGAASVAVHILLGLAIYPLTQGPPTRRFTNFRVEPEKRVQVTPLIAPPAPLTQKEPNTKPLSAEFNVASIAPRRETQALPNPGAAALPKPAPVKKFVPPRQPGSPTPAAAIPDAPKLDVRASAAPPPQALGVPNTPAPPQIQHQEKPKIAFENPGATTGVSGQTGLARIPTKRTTVDDAVRQAIRGGSGGLLSWATSRRPPVSGLPPHRSQYRVSSAPV